MQNVFCWFVALLNLSNRYTLMIVLFQGFKTILPVIDPIEKDKQYGFDFFVMIKFYLSEASSSIIWQNILNRFDA